MNRLDFIQNFYGILVVWSCILSSRPHFLSVSIVACGENTRKVCKSRIGGE